MRTPAKSTYLLLSLVVLVLDQWTKHLIEKNFSLLETREVIPGFFNLTHIRNSGVAFGFLAHGGSSTTTLFLMLLGVGALTAVAVYFWRTPRDERSLLLSLSLILGGAIGNLVDRVTSGAVTDFLDFYAGSYHWHTFNVADSAITVGVGVMLIDIVFSKRRDSHEDAG